MSGTQPHSHKRPSDENEMPRNARTRARKPRIDPKAQNGTLMRHEVWHTSMQISEAINDAKQPRNVVKQHPMHGIVPKYEIWHPKWPIAMPNMHCMNVKCEERNKAVPK